MEDKVIIIGNGSSVLDKELGKKIDSFNTIVRINNYKTKGYEKHVGSKTNIWGRNNSNRTKERDCSIFDQVIIASPPRDFSSKNNYKSALKLHNSIKNSIMVNENVKNDLQKKLKLRGSSKSIRFNRNRKIGDTSGWPSTGLIIIAHFLSIQKKPLVLYGFDSFKKIKGQPRHYYNNIEAMPTSVMHQGEREEKYIKNMVRKNRIILL